MADEVEDTGATAPRATIMDRCVCLVLHKSKFGNRRKAALPGIASATRAEATLLSHSKRLLDSDEMAAVNAVDGEIRGFVESICMPSMFKGGVYLVPHALIDRVVEELKKLKIKRNEAVEAFLLVYPTQVGEIETRLADQFDARNYPSIDDMREKFKFGWQFVTYGVPGSLKAIKASLFEEEKEKYAGQLKEAADEYRVTLRARLLDFVVNLAKQLEPSGDGKKKRIYEGQVEQLSTALSMFELQDVTDDGELKAIVQRARAVMAGVDVDQLRDDEAFRARIEKGLVDVAGALRIITEDTHTREIEL